MQSSAQPILASSLLEREMRLHNVTETACFDPKAQRLVLPAQRINSMLNGGFAFGTLSCITNDINTDAQDLVHALVVAHLVSETPGRVVVVDSTPAFDVRRLHGTLTAAIRAQKNSAEPAVAMKLLDIVQIMKVFDYVGVVEALDELQGEELEIRKEQGANTTGDKAARPGTIADSQDGEDETYGGTGVEEAIKSTSTTREEDKPASESTPALLIIRDLAQVITPLLKNNYTQGQAQLNSLLRSIRHFASANNCCTVVLCRASARNTPTGATAAGNDDDHVEGASQFSEKTMRPALGHGVGYLVDLHLFHYHLSLESTSAEGAAVAMAAKSTANVLEVVEDRHEGAVGRWAAFTFDFNGIAQDVPA